jgi:hypothetical protein
VGSRLLRISPPPFYFPIPIPSFNLSLTIMSRPQVSIDRLTPRRATVEPREAMNCKSCRKRKVSIASPNSPQTTRNADAGTAMLTWQSNANANANTHANAIPDQM